MNNLPPGIYNQMYHGQSFQPIIQNPYTQNQHQYMNQRFFTSQPLQFVSQATNIYNGAVPHFVPFAPLPGNINHIPNFTQTQGGLQSSVYNPTSPVIFNNISSMRSTQPYVALDLYRRQVDPPVSQQVEAQKPRSQPIPPPPLESPNTPLPPLPTLNHSLEEEATKSKELLKDVETAVTVEEETTTHKDEYEDISSDEDLFNDMDGCHLEEIKKPKVDIFPCNTLSVDRLIGERKNCKMEENRKMERKKELEEINKLIDKGHHERKRDFSNQSDVFTESPSKRKKILIDEKKSSSKVVERNNEEKHNSPRKKKRRKSKEKRKSKDKLKISYYTKDESTENLVEANILLIDLHDKFEAFRKTKQPKERSTIDDSIAYNPDKKDIEECSCTKEKMSRGVHHNKYPKQKFIEACKRLSNNTEKLFHYKLTISPCQNFMTKRPTVVYHDGKEFRFDGFSVFSHSSLDELPFYTFQRNAFEYTIKLEKSHCFPQNFCIKDLDLIQEFWFYDLFELNNWEFDEKCGCPPLHFMPRFICEKNKDGQFEYLPMAELLLYHLESYTLFHDDNEVSMDWTEFQKINKGTIIFNPNKKPRSLRVDDFYKDNNQISPQFVHTSSIPEIAQVHLKDLRPIKEEISKISKSIRNRPVQSKNVKERLFKLQQQLDEMTEKRSSTKFKDVKISMKGYYNTGLRWDVFQHVSYLHGFWKHYKFVSCLNILEEHIKYTFKDKSLLKTAVTLPSYLDQSSMDRCTNVSVHNLGRRKPEFNPSKVENPGTRRRGVMSLAHVMATLRDENTDKISKCPHNERLEFLGDALLDYLTSLHLFLMFPDKDAGQLTRFRTDIVRTYNLGQIGKAINLEDFLLLGHHSGIKFDENMLEHYQGNTLEGIIGAVYLDGGLNACDKLLCNLLFSDDKDLAHIWKSNNQHPLQKLNPNGDREMIPDHKVLQNMCELENVIGIQFKNIRLLARAFVRNVSSLKDPTLTGGDYNRLEFLGDAILKYICSDYLYHTFPDHQEGPLTLLRISMVNAKYLTTAALDLGLDNFIVFESPRDAQHAKSKVYSDVFESLLGAIHIDRNPKGIQYCRKIIEVSILSRLDELIMNQDWIDPKTQLQQCCLSLREDKTEEDYPVYK